MKCTLHEVDCLDLMPRLDAALSLGCEYVGCEVDPHYAAVARRRLEAFTEVAV